VEPIDLYASGKEKPPMLSRSCTMKQEPAADACRMCTLQTRAAAIVTILHKTVQYLM